MLILAAVAAGLVVWLCVYRSLRRRWAQVNMVIDAKEGVDEGFFTTIGGADQWLRIRGESRSNPILLFLHGGPGVSYSAFSEAFRSWERDFIVVHWDQPGAGKTLGKSGVTELNIAKMVSDGIEVAQFLTSHLGQEKIVLFGHSWGTILGLLMGKERPELFAAYVGTGQVVNMASSELLSYRLLLEQARNHPRALKRLETIGPPPYKDIRTWMIKQRLIVMTSPAPNSGKLPDIMTAPFFHPDYSLLDAVHWYRGMSVSIRELYGAFMAFDARIAVPELHIPVLIVQGDKDMQAPLLPVTEYFETLAAPSKKLVVLEGEGHTAVMSIPETILAAIRNWSYPAS
jgi:proline iminopeptidase